MAKSSDLAFIQVQQSNPFVLFQEWKEEYQKFDESKFFIINLATCDKYIIIIFTFFLILFII